MMEKIPFTTENDGETVEFYVLGSTTLRGVSYLLVTEKEEGDSPCYILKDKSRKDDSESLYKMVEDDMERKVVSRLFEEILEDVRIEQE